METKSGIEIKCTKHQKEVIIADLAYADCKNTRIKHSVSKIREDIENDIVWTIVDEDIVMGEKTKIE